jgi:hypothetical protein
VYCLLPDENSFDLDCVGGVVSGRAFWRQVVAPVKNMQVSVTAKRGFLHTALHPNISLIAIHRLLFIYLTA